jgi:hypothetical protein
MEIFNVEVPDLVDRIMRIAGNTECVICGRRSILHWPELDRSEVLRDGFGSHEVCFSMGCTMFKVPECVDSDKQ